MANETQPQPAVDKPVPPPSKGPVKNPLYVHTHHIASHFTNALSPVGAALLTLYFLTGVENFESASFYCFLVSTVAAPAVFFSGLADWLSRFQGRSTRIFNHKRIFGVLFMLVSIIVVAWRLFDPAVALAGGVGGWLYMLLVYAGAAMVTYLGYLGGKFI